MENALLNEEYEIAAEIRDRIQFIQQEGVITKKSKKSK